MLSFKEMTARDRDMYVSYCGGARFTEGSFVSLFAWRNLSKLRICEQDGVLYRQFTADCPTYMFPLCRDPDKLPAALKTLKDDYPPECGCTLKLRLLSEEQKQIVENLGGFRLEEDRDQADYLYNASDLIELTGRTYHSKRNFIAQFERAYNDRWSFEDITPADRAEVMEFQKKWVEHAGASDSLKSETAAVSELLSSFEELRLKGGILRVDDETVGYTIGSVFGDTLFVSIEKAHHAYVGAYPMINREFAKRAVTGDTMFINREEDMGIEGLRRAKMSYNPTQILMKYTAYEQ